MSRAMRKPCQHCAASGEVGYMGVTCIYCLGQGTIETDEAESSTEKPMTLEAGKDYPRVICDREGCMCEAEIELFELAKDNGLPDYSTKAVLKCHGEWQMISFNAFGNRPPPSKKWTLVWSNIVESFLDEDAMFLRERNALEDTLDKVQRLTDTYRVRRAQNAPRPSISQEQLTKLIDALLLYKT